MSSEGRKIKAVTGSVVSDKMDKTIVVLVKRTVRHPLYKKYIRFSTKVLAHDARNECHNGDVVVIEVSRPISKRKAWRLKKIVSTDALA